MYAANIGTFPSLDKFRLCGILWLDKLTDKYKENQMGYSCAIKASNVYDALIVQLQVGFDGDSQNTWTHKGVNYFCEIGREHSDGAITGTVHKFTGHNLCKHAGNFRIERSGAITCFPTSTKAQRESAMTVGLVKFHEVHGGGWKEDEVLSRILGDCSFVVV